MLIFYWRNPNSLGKCPNQTEFNTFHPALAYKQKERVKTKTRHPTTVIGKHFMLIIISFAWFSSGALICLGNMNFAFPCIRRAGCIWREMQIKAWGHIKERWHRNGAEERNRVRNMEEKLRRLLVTDAKIIFSSYTLRVPAWRHHQRWWREHWGSHSNLAVFSPAPFIFQDMTAPGKGVASASSPDPDHSHALVLHSKI